MHQTNVLKLFLDKASFSIFLLSELYFKAIQTKSKEQDKLKREKKGTTVKDRGFKKSVTNEKVHNDPDNEMMENKKEDETKNTVDDSESVEDGNDTLQLDEKEKEKSKKKKKKGKKDEESENKALEENETLPKKPKKSKKRKLTEDGHAPSDQDDDIQDDKDVLEKPKKKKKKKSSTKNTDIAESGTTKVKVTDKSIKKLGRKQTGVVKVVKIKKQTENSDKLTKKSKKLKKVQMDDRNNLANLLQINGGDGNEFGSGSVSNW